MCELPLCDRRCEQSSIHISYQLFWFSRCICSGRYSLRSEAWNTIPKSRQQHLLKMAQYNIYINNLDPPCQQTFPNLDGFLSWRPALSASLTFWHNHCCATWWYAENLKSLLRANFVFNGTLNTYKYSRPARLSPVSKDTSKFKVNKQA